MPVVPIVIKRDEDSIRCAFASSDSILPNL